MPSISYPETKLFRAVFEDEIAAIGGTISDTFHDKSCLFARSILPDIGEVGPGDKVSGGVAIRAARKSICVHPYVFRLVCRNGTIMAKALQTWRIEQVDIRDLDEVSIELREAIRACASEEAFAESTLNMRSTHQTDADAALALLPHLARWSGRAPRGFKGDIVQRLLKETERHSGFGVLNAVTALARDTSDPYRRWDLEELGGALAMVMKRPRPRPIGVAKGVATA